MKKYYGSNYGVGSTKFGRKIFTSSGHFDKQDLFLAVYMGTSQSIILDVYDYGISFGFCGCHLCIGWFVADCGVWTEDEITERQIISDIIEGLK